MENIISREDILFITASKREEFNDGRNLFIQYANSLDIDLCFQDFPNELATIDKQYNKPRGSLLLAYKHNVAIACVGIRELDRDTAELKRMYVSTRYRRYKIGTKLLKLAIEIARELGYNAIRLDTLPAITPALNLYRSFGFYEIASYRFNPVSGTVYMEKKLE